MNLFWRQQHFENKAPTCVNSYLMGNKTHIYKSYYVTYKYLSTDTLGEEYKLWSSLLRSFLQSPITSSLFGPNILLNTHSLCSSLNVRDQVSHQYRTTGKIIVLYILIFTLVDNRRGDKRFRIQFFIALFILPHTSLDFRNVLCELISGDDYKKISIHLHYTDIFLCLLTFCMSIPHQHLATVPLDLLWITQIYVFSISISYVGFDVISAVVVESSVFCGITPYSRLKVLHDSLLFNIFFNS
jgi:hypothetical protein